MKTHHYRIRSLHEVFATARMLGEYFDHTDDAITGMYELLMNAIEHGNLEIGYVLKTELLETGKWEEEIWLRQSCHRYAHRHVDIVVTVDGGWSTVTIIDGGRGFDWTQYAGLEIGEAGAHGRGLAIAQRCGFASLQFSSTGNAVTCRGLYRRLASSKLECPPYAVQTAVGHVAMV